MRPLAHVRFRHRRAGTLTWCFGSTTCRTLSRVESLVVQALRAQHPGEEIEIVDLRWTI